MSASDHVDTSIGPTTTSSEEVFVLPASYAQQRLWFLDRLAPGQSVYNVAGALRLTGTLVVEALRQTIDAIVARCVATFVTCSLCKQPVPPDYIVMDDACFSCARTHLGWTEPVY